MWNRSATTGRLESISTEAFGDGATHGVTRAYTHAAGGRVKKIAYAGGALGTAGTSLQAFHYQHDAHGRRKTVAPYALDEPPPNTAELPPGWAYDYNQRGEVTLADRFKGVDDDLPSDLVTHQRRSYDYDLMGNRNWAAQGTDTVAEDPVPITYSANLLQQYNGITHTRQVELTGQAVAGADVELTLDGGSAITLRHDVERTQSAHLTGDPNSFRYVHTMTGTEARWLHVSIKASVGTTHITRSGYTYVPPASESLDYDEDRNLTSDGQWTYTWDAENRLKSATQRPLPVAAGFTAPARKHLAFKYDYKSRRISKKVSVETVPSSDVDTWALTKDLRFVYDGWQMIAELDHTFAPVTSTGLAGSAVNRTFLWGPDLSGTMTGAGGVGGLLSTTYQGVTYQVCSDANGNVTGLVPVGGTGAGTLVARFDYDPFGNRVTNAGPSVELCPFGFSNTYTDAETSWCYYGHRYYSANLGGWPSRDPIEEFDGPNLYSMLRNNPVNMVDIDGRTGWGPNPNMPPGHNPITGAPMNQSSDSGDDLVELGINRVLGSAFLRCYLIDLSDEELEEINQAIINEMNLADTSYFQGMIADLPRSAGTKFLALNAAVRSALASIPQGSAGPLGVSSQSLAAQFMNRHRILVAVRSKLRDKSIQWVGKGGVKVWGRLGSKLVPIVGWFSAGYEAVKACNCYRVTGDNKFTNDEKIIGQ